MTDSSLAIRVTGQALRLPGYTIRIATRITGNIGSLEVIIAMARVA